MNRTLLSGVAPTSPRVTGLAILSATLATYIVCFAGDDAGMARAEVILSNYDIAHHFPVLGGKYQSTNSTAYPSAPIPLKILGLELIGPSDVSDTIPFPTPPTMDPKFVDTTKTAIAVVQFDPTKLPELFGRLPADRYRIYLIEDGTERLILDFTIQQGHPVETPENMEGVFMAYESEDGQPFIFRESPTRPSLGEHLVTPLPGNQFRIDSFFDIWTEISLDGGTTYHPAASALRLELTAVVPEPATLLISMVGAVSCGTFALRRWRVTAACGYT